ncbi:MAG: transcriptional repressor [Chlorobiaceae bacterium]|nr:transcriptional repressor [Chlorobiaceae bacterium]
MQDALKLLRQSGLKITPRRRAILSEFSDSSIALSPRMVQERLKLQFSRCGLPGIYRNLEALADCGVLVRLAGFGRQRSYALCRYSEKDTLHYHQIICISCGRIGRLHECVWHEGMKVDGFTLVSHMVQLQGICASCASTETEK